MNKKLIYSGAAMLLTGLIIGWLIAGAGRSTSDDSTGMHEHIEEDIIYTCSMHPQIRSHEPGDCPICGMELVALTSNKEEIKGTFLSDNAMRLGNIRTMKITEGSEEPTVRLTGQVIPNEKFIASQSSHIGGRIEKLLSTYSGEKVRRGEVIAYIYSPELVNAEKELLIANKMKDKQPELFAAAKEKLKNWKLSDRQINDILETGSPEEEFPILSDYSGTITEINVDQGDHVKQGQTLYKIADLSRLWISLEVHESEMPLINVGNEVVFTAQALPGEEFKGQISFIDPIINPVTRIATARITMTDKDGKLKPGMYVSASVTSAGNEELKNLMIPASAVLWTGDRSVVYVSQQSADGKIFNLRPVLLGARSGENYIIKEGLQPGDEIVVNGTFTVDAATQLAGNQSMMNYEEEEKLDVFDRANIDVGEGEDMKTYARNEFEKTIDVPEEVKRTFNTLFKAYLPVKNALIDGDLDVAKENLHGLVSNLDDFETNKLPEEAAVIMKSDLKVMKNFSESMLGSDNMDGLRSWFSPLSDQLYHTLKKFGIKDIGYRQYCPMAFDFKGAFWLSDSEKILNPYFGDEMLTCGNVEEEL